MAKVPAVIYRLSDYARLVEWGIDSISVNVDAIDRTRQNVAAAEQRLILAQARERCGEGRPIISDSRPQ